MEKEAFIDYASEWLSTKGIYPVPEYLEVFWDGCDRKRELYYYLLGGNGSWEVKLPLGTEVEAIYKGIDFYTRSDFNELVNIWISHYGAGSQPNPVEIIKNGYLVTRSGQQRKLSKVLSDACTYIDKRGDNDPIARFNVGRFLERFKENEILISASPIRFLKAGSYTGCTSCVRPDGEYKYTVPAYAASESVLITFIKRDTAMLSRQWLYIYNNGKTVMLGRAYGQLNVYQAAQLSRYVLQRQSAKLGVENVWKKFWYPKYVKVNNPNNTYFDTCKMTLQATHLSAITVKTTISRWSNEMPTLYIDSSISYDGDDIEDIDTRSYCSCCDDEFPEDELIYVSGDSLVCQHCLDRRYSRCDHCEEFFDNDNIEELGGETLCQNCYDKQLDHYTNCAVCEELTHLDDTQETLDGEYVCGACYDELYEDGRICDKCDNVMFDESNLSVTVLSDISDKYWLKMRFLQLFKAEQLIEGVKLCDDCHNNILTFALHMKTKREFEEQLHIFIPYENNNRAEALAAGLPLAMIAEALNEKEISKFIGV